MKCVIFVTYSVYKIDLSILVTSNHDNEYEGQTDRRTVMYKDSVTFKYTTFNLFTNFKLS